MIPLISEFSYGFALTNEIAGLTQLNAAPIFPSLLEEGKEGGGYDVHLDLPGLPVFLQFKRSEYMVRNTAREIKFVREFCRNNGLRNRFSAPIYRFPITDAKKSKQHRMLLDLESTENLVAYAAPNFWNERGINQAWLNNEVLARSKFVTPSEIGYLPSGHHAVAWNRYTSYICSEPRKLDLMSGSQFLQLAAEKLQRNEVPVLKTIKELVEKADEIENSLEAGLYDFEPDEDLKPPRVEAKIMASSDPDEMEIIPRPIDLDTYPTLPDPPEGDRRHIRKLADKAYQLFGSQLLILQNINGD